MTRRPSASNLDAVMDWLTGQERKYTSKDYAFFVKERKAKERLESNRRKMETFKKKERDPNAFRKTAASYKGKKPKMNPAAAAARADVSVNNPPGF